MIEDFPLVPFLIIGYIINFIFALIIFYMVDESRYLKQDILDIWKKIKKFKNRKVYKGWFLSKPMNFYYRRRIGN